MVALAGGGLITVRRESDLTTTTSSTDNGGQAGEWGVFGPTLTHQVFENQLIRGYKRPRVSVLYTSDSLLAFLRFDYDEKRFRTPLARGEEQQVITDVPGLLAKWLPPSGVASSFDDFARVRYSLLAPASSSSSFFFCSRCSGGAYRRWAGRSSPRATRSTPTRWRVAAGVVRARQTTGPPSSTRSGRAPSPWRTSASTTNGSRFVCRPAPGGGTRLCPPHALPCLAHCSSSPLTRLQLFLIWFIDRSSYIDDTDLDWELYFMYARSPYALTRRHTRNRAR